MKTNIISNKLPSRAAYVLGAVGLFVATLLPSLNLQVGAASIEARKLTLASSASGSVSTDIAGNAVDPGDPGNGAQTSHTFDFTMPTGGTVQSIEFRYCLQTAVVSECDVPTGLVLTNLTDVSAQTAPGAAFSFAPVVTDADTGSNNVLRLTRTEAGVVGSPTAFSFTFGGTGDGWITNPTNNNETFFVQITTYTDNAYTTERDTGTVASSTAQQIDITAKVQEKLRFSVGVDTPIAPGDKCDAGFTDTGQITLGDSDGILDSTIQYDDDSYFRLSTNAINGTIVQYSGNTLQSGSNDIDAMNPKDVSAEGVEGFGIGVNTAATGYDVTDLVPEANYADGTGTLGDPGVEFFFDTASATAPVTIATANDVVACDTAAVRYVANISTITPAGVYTSTITYIAVPAF